MTGIGPVAVRQPRVRDREAAEGERIRYSPSILPRYARRSKSLEVLIPVLYLKGLSTGDSRKRWRPSSARTRQVYRRRPLPTSRACPRGGAGGVERGACALAKARSVGQALRLLLGRRHPFGGPARGTGAVHPGHHRRDAGRQEGTSRFHRWPAREFTIVARSAARSEASRSDNGAADC